MHHAVVVSSSRLNVICGYRSIRPILHRCWGPAQALGARRVRPHHRLFASATTRRAVETPSAAAQASTAAQQQQQQPAGTSSSSSNMICTAAAAAAAAGPGTGTQAAPAAATQHQQQLFQVSSLDHPSTIPLHVAGDAVVDAAGNKLLQKLSPQLTVNEHESRNGVLVFGASSQQGPTSCWDVTVGSLKFKRYLSCARNKLWWMTPEWGTSLHTLPPETQFLLLELEDEKPSQQQQQQQGAGSSSSSGGRYALVLPLIDGDFRATARPNRSWTDREGSLCIRIESGDDNTKGESCDSVLLVACSSDPFHLVDAGVAAAAALSGGAAPRAAKQLPASLDGFGWCTWDAFYSTVSARGLLEGLGSLQAGGITPRLLIIDDGWQLTDVDPPYGKAPTAQLAEKLPETGRAAEVFDTTREMLLETQDTYYEESAKLLGQASTQMQQEVRNLFPTVANTGVISHHHAPPAASWDAPAEATAAAKEQELEIRRSREEGEAGSSGSSGSSSRSSRRMKQQQQQQRQQLSVVSEDDGSLPDWAEKRQAGRHHRSQQNGGAEEQQPLLQQQQQPAATAGSSGSSSSSRSRFGKYGVDLASLADKYGVDLAALEDVLRDPKKAAAAAETRLKAAAHEAEERLKVAVEGAEDAVVQALVKAAPTPRQQFILIRWAQKAAGALVGLATAAFLLFYQWCIEPAAPNSLRVKAFAALTNGVLRGAMLSFFASASDFTRRLTSVEANAKFSRLDAGPEEDWEATPADLRGVVSHIKQKFGVRHVYCWHGLPAYWGGVMPGTPSLSGVTEVRLVFPKPTASIAEVEPSLLWSPAVLAGVGIADDPGVLYNRMHAYLAASAVDGVKVDCQAGVGLVGSVLGGGPSAARRFQAALEDSIARHFPGNHAINCMCHSSENFYRFSHTAVARVSDDYYPRDPASSTPHIGACAYNSLYMGALVQPDWDMFQSAHPAGMLHGMARAVSGGAVYVSDKPGQHDFTLLRRLVLPDGSVLRALLPGRPTRDCVFRDALRDNETMLKVWNINPVVGIVGCFNLQGSSWDRNRRKFHIHDKRGSELRTQVYPHDIEPFRQLQQQQPAHAGTAAVVSSDDGSSNGQPGGRWAGAAAAAGVDAAAAAAAAGEQASGNSTQQEPQQQVQVQQPQQFAVYRYGTEELRVCGGSDGIAVELGRSGSDLVWISPLQQAAAVSFAPLGLVEMFNGGGAVLRSSVVPGHERSSSSNKGASAAAAAGGVGASTSSGPSAVATLQLRGCGRFLAYSSARPRVVLLNLTPHKFTWDEFTHRLEFVVPQTSEELQCEVEVLYE